MASGGMDWAYRTISAFSLDPLAVAIVLHLGWRDAAAFRTDRGIARALSQHRSSVAKATAKLRDMGLIARRSGQWVAAETVAIVEETASARRPAARAADDAAAAPQSGADHSVGRTTQWAGGGPLSGPQTDHSVGHKRKENKRKGARVENVRPAGRSALHRNDAARPASSPKRDGGPVACAAVGGAGGGAAAEAVSLLSRMGSYETSLLLQGRDSFIAGQPLKAASPLFEALRQAARAQDAEKRGAA